MAKKRIPEPDPADERRKELLKIFEGADDQRKIAAPLIEDVVFLERRLEELRRLPQIEVNKKNPANQRQTEAAKQYVKLFQQYNQAVKTLCTILRKDSGDEESPLRAYLRMRGNRDD